MLSITIIINALLLYFLNLYFYNTTTLFSFLLSFLPASSFTKAVDFDCHHRSYYGPAATDYPDLILDASTCSIALISSVKIYELLVSNILAIDNYFVHKDNQPSIMDLE